MIELTEVIQQIPAMLSGETLTEALRILPEYDDEIRAADTAIRLMALNDLYKIYVPNQMSTEIYSKLYLALLRSLQKKGTKLAVQQQNQNFKAIMRQEYSGIIGGSDSFTIIGPSGLGKSSAISRAITLISDSRLIEVDKPFTKIIPCLCVQCPYDSSVKGLLLEILRKVDEALESKYYYHAVRSRATIDMLIGSVSQVALNHVGLLVVDEIQCVVNSKNGKGLVGTLTQLINNSGISICMVGTPESAVFFEQAQQLARRSLGLRYDVMEYGEVFQSFCEALYSYQYTQQRTETTEGVTRWLYEHSSGNISIVVSLIHDAQEMAILNGREVLDMESLNEAYQQRLSLLHSYITPSVPKIKQTSKPVREITVSAMDLPVNDTKDVKFKISDLVAQAKGKDIDVVELLRAYVSVTEVAL